MSRTLLSAITAALSVAALSFAAPATAGPGAYYQADLASPAAKTRLVAKGLVWNCADTRCAATKKSPSRDAIVCAALVKEVGLLTGFTAAGEAFGGEDLARCNAAA